MSASPLKEQYREQLVIWSESVREKDPDIFLRISIQESKAHTFPVWVLSDARRPTDLKFFQQECFTNCEVFRIRIKATDEVRTSRGWVFTPGIDDKTTECGLDTHNDWELIIDNNDNSDQQLLELLEHVINAAKAVQ